MNNNTIKETETVQEVMIEQEMTQDHTEDLWQEIEIEGIEDVGATHNSRSTGGPGVLSIINSEECGRRLQIAKDVINKLENPQELEIKISKTGILLNKATPNSKKIFKVKKQGSKTIVYCSPLVKELTEKFSLDYSKVTSLTFVEVNYGLVGGNKTAHINLI